MVASVYAAFFLVQSLFNFDGPEPVNSQNIYNYSSSLFHAAKNTRLAGNTAHAAHTHTVRLNKRFHQENIPPCDVLVVAAPAPFVVRTMGVPYRDPFLLSYTPLHRPLRGPPAVV
jgi:hypothetical protein